MPDARPSTMGSAARRLTGLVGWLCLPAALTAQAPSAPDWRSDWALAEGFTLRRDAEGFRFPTSIAFVPQPGPAPDDALYFVTRVRLWMRHHIREPKFDNPLSQMPALDVSDADAVRLTDFLLGPSKPVPPPPKTVGVGRPQPKVRYRHVALAFVLGLGLGGTGALAAARRRRHGQTHS